MDRNIVSQAHHRNSVQILDLKSEQQMIIPNILFNIS